VQSYAAMVVCSCTAGQHAQITHVCMQAAFDIAARGGLIVKIPMDETHVRSLNLATSVGIGLYEVCKHVCTGHSNCTET
jgi:hypothetical protein